MANELNIALSTGLTVTAQAYTAGAASGSPISLSEVGTSGFYSGNMTGSAGTYQLVFLSGGATVGTGQINWSGTAEIPFSTLTTADIPNSDISAIKSKTDNLPASPAAVSDIPTTAQISAAVEGSLLDENDGQQILNAIVGAIGNQNVDEIALVAAIRSDLERNGGKLDSIPTDSAPSAASVATAVWSASTKEITGGTVTTLTNSPDVPTEAEIATAVWGASTKEITGGTVTNLTNAPASVTPADIWDYNNRTLTSASGPTAVEIRQEIDANSSKLDVAISSRLADADYVEPANSDVAAIKVKTDALVVERLNNCATTAIVGNLLAQANS